MRSALKFSVSFLLIGILFCLSCKKEYSCEGCRGGNKPPIANAGPDQVITLPPDSVLLDGSSSSDPDGMISSYGWTKISGPASFTIIKPTDSITKVKTLVAGTYQFELKVTDNGGLSAKDTIRVIVDSVLTTNHPPIANAGTDHTLILPANAVNLDGSASTDPENNITSYSWTKISGPTSFNIANASGSQTAVTELMEGVYLFELKVTDAEGLFSKDTVQMTVNTALGNCPVIPAQLIPFGTLSQARSNLVAQSAGSKILFTGDGTTGVDIYDINTNSWTTAELSKARAIMVTAAVGNKIFFAGGDEGYSKASTRVDIYDAGNNTWSFAELSQGRYLLSAATVGSKILFAGGYNYFLVNGGSDRVDIYDNSTDTWSTASLSQGRWGLSATATGDKIYFAGGEARNTGGGGAGHANIVDRIDIYDAITNTWSTSMLGEARGYMPNVAIDGKIYWAGGASSISTITNDYEFSSNVEIREVRTNISSYVRLCNSPIAGYNDVAALKNNAILFFPGYGFGESINKFVIYDISSNDWSTGVLPQSITGAAIISVNNTIYVAGGYVNGILSNQVWKLEF